MKSEWHFSQITGLITGYRFVDFRHARSLRHSCGPVRDERERTCACVLHAADKEEFLAIAIKVKRVSGVTHSLPYPAGIEKQFRTARLGHTILFGDFCYVDLILVKKEKFFACRSPHRKRATLG